MKQKNSWLLIALICTAFSAAAQVPQAINYQAIARNIDGTIISATTIGVRFSIHDGSSSGTVVYQETHQTTTNTFGLFTLAIGRGLVVSGNFTTINWGTGSKFLEVEIAVGGGIYQLQGTTELLSVPYALYAEKTNLIAGAGISITNGNVIAATGNHWVADANGIHNSNASGNVGIGGNSRDINRLTVFGTAAQPYAAEINSDNTWQTAVNLYNQTSNWRWAITAGGSANTEATYGVGQRNFGIANDQNTSNNTTFPLIITWDDLVGIGMGAGGTNNMPKAQLHVRTGDIYIEAVNSGVIMKSPDGQCWRMTVSNAGTPVFTSITCP